jgi:hypothetical protein
MATQMGAAVGRIPIEIVHKDSLPGMVVTQTDDAMNDPFET